MSEYYARLRPFDPRREHAMRVFVLGHLRFDAGAWVAVDTSTAEALRRVHQSYYDPLSPVAFEICSRAEHDAQESTGAADGGEDPEAPTKSPANGRTTRKTKEG